MVCGTRIHGKHVFSMHQTNAVRNRTTSVCQEWLGHERPKNAKRRSLYPLHFTRSYYKRTNDAKYMYVAV